MNPIIQRELMRFLRTRRALALQFSLAALFSLLILLRWPTDEAADLSGAQSQRVFRLFGYGLLAALLALTPIFPATSIIREKQQGTLALLFNSPMRPWSIYFGKLAGVVCLVMLMFTVTLPAAAACYALGGISIWTDLVPLYGVLMLVAVQYAALGLLVSSHAHATDSAVRITYGLTLLMAVVAMGPHFFLQGKPGYLPVVAEWLRCLSPIPAVMEILGHADTGARGLISRSGMPLRFALLAMATIFAFAIATRLRLSYAMFDRARWHGVMTEDRSTSMQWARRMFFIVDPQRRKGGIPWPVNPVMVKEFRCRRFGRSHWMLRLAALCAVASLLLTYFSATSTMSWGVEAIGGVLVLLQMSLAVLIAPSLGAGLISTERESGGWDLLRMTPLSAGTILRGKLISVVWPLSLVLLASLPGYAIMTMIRPELSFQISRVLICLAFTAVFTMILSAAVSSFFRRTATATMAVYALLGALWGATMLVWLGRDAPFGRQAVENVLSINPIAAALSVIEAPGFAEYHLVPLNWWIMGSATAVLFVVLAAQTWRLTRPL